MRLSTKVRYAVLAIARLASYHATKPISIKKIAEQEAITPQYLEQLFFKLKRKKLITSQRGHGGGFLLNEFPADISIKTICDAVGEKIFPVPCTDPDAGCPRMKNCTMARVWAKLSGEINSFLKTVTIGDLLGES